MPFPWTLQRYIFREMAKTFLLAAAGMTVTLSLGGGLLRMIEFGDVTPSQLFRIMCLVIPVAAALTLPIAVLFSAAATYGRLAADNEFVACRSGGINLHVLFLPTLILGLFSAAVTFGFTNFLIPGIIRNLDEFIAADLPSMIQQRLNRRQGLTLGGPFRIFADDVEVDPLHPHRVRLQKIMFVEVENEEWTRYGTAREVRADFDRMATPLRVTAQMLGLSFYDRQAGRFGDLEEQIIGPMEIPTVPLLIKYLDWTALWHYRTHIDQWHQVTTTLRELRMNVGRRAVVQALERDLADDRVLTLKDDRFECTIRSDGPPARIPRDEGIELGTTTIEEQRDGRLRSASAERVLIEVTRGDTLDSSSVVVEAYNAQIILDRRIVNRAKETFGPIAIPERVREEIKQMSVDELLAPAPAPTTLDRDPVAERREAALNMRADALRRIAATLNERTAFSASVLVLVILAAALGIVYRGAHTIVAFGIAFVPSLFVIITIVMGKQLAHNTTTHWIGLAMMWLGIGLTAGLDIWTLTRAVRR